MLENIQLQLLLATFAGSVGRQQSVVIAYLVEENRVLKEQLESGGKRLRFTDDQRRRLAAKGKPLGRRVVLDIATIVTPDTILSLAEFGLSSDCPQPSGRFANGGVGAARSPIACTISGNVNVLRGLQGANFRRSSTIASLKANQRPLVHKAGIVADDEYARPESHRMLDGQAENVSIDWSVENPDRDEGLT